MTLVGDIAWNSHLAFAQNPVLWFRNRVLPVPKHSSTQRFEFMPTSTLPLLWSLVPRFLEESVVQSLHSFISVVFDPEHSSLFFQVGTELTGWQGRPGHIWRFPAHVPPSLPRSPQMDYAMLLKYGGFTDHCISFQNSVKAPSSLMFA